jgi:hypothetical protein
VHKEIDNSFDQLGNKKRKYFVVSIDQKQMRYPEFVVFEKKKVLFIIFCLYNLLSVINSNIK